MDIGYVLGAVCASEYPTKHMWSGKFFNCKRTNSSKRSRLCYYFADEVFECIFWKGIVLILWTATNQAIEYSINRRRPISVMHICVRRPQWVNSQRYPANWHRQFQITVNDYRQHIVDNGYHVNTMLPYILRIGSWNVDIHWMLITGNQGLNRLSISWYCYQWSPRMKEFLCAINR